MNYYYHSPKRLDYVRDNLNYFYNEAYLALVDKCEYLLKRYNLNVNSSNLFNYISILYKNKVLNEKIDIDKLNSLDEEIPRFINDSYSVRYEIRKVLLYDLFKYYIKFLFLYKNDFKKLGISYTDINSANFYLDINNDIFNFVMPLYNDKNYIFDYENNTFNEKLSLNFVNAINIMKNTVYDFDHIYLNFFLIGYNINTFLVNMIADYIVLNRNIVMKYDKYKMKYYKYENIKDDNIDNEMIELNFFNSSKLIKLYEYKSDNSAF